MAISAISSSSGYVPQPLDPTRQAFSQLTSAIQSGDLAAAQTAYTNLMQAGGSNSSNPLSQAISQIGDALQSGDIGKAQQALATLQQQMQSMKGAHRHHGHHHGGDHDQPQATAAPPSTTSDPANPNTTSLDLTA